MNAQAGDEPLTYRIALQGQLDESWSNWLGGMSVSIEGTKDDIPVTVLTGSVADQPALRGILNRLWDLNLTVISMNRVVAEKE